MVFIHFILYKAPVFLSIKFQVPLPQPNKGKLKYQFPFIFSAIAGLSSKQDKSRSPNVPQIKIRLCNYFEYSKSDVEFSALPPPRQAEQTLSFRP